MVENISAGLAFQLTRPRGARHYFYIYMRLGMAFQLTRPRGARPDSIQEFANKYDVISTHAPAGGATFTEEERNDCSGIISTHAPAGGATLPRLPPPVCAVYFNSRARGGRDIFLSTIFTRLIISTHAPAGGATPAPVRRH